MKTAKTGYLNNYSCPRCKKNWGYINTDSHGATYFCGEEECLKDDCRASKGIEDKQKSMRPSNIIDKMGIGSRYQKASLANCKLGDEDSKKTINWLNEANRQFLVFLGPPDTGKTYFCAAVASYLDEKNKIESTYVNPRRFYETIQKAIAAGKNQYDAIRNFAQAEFLIFDDLGASTCSQWQQEVTFDLIDQRYIEQLPMIITSNLTFDEITNSFDARLTRRLNNDENVIIESF